MKLVSRQMKSYGKSRRIKKDKWANRMAIMGITLVVMCLAVAINIKGADLKQSDLDYQIREETLARPVAEVETRTDELQVYQIYVKNKQYAVEVSKERLRRANSRDLLLQPTKS